MTTETGGAGESTATNPDPKSKAAAKPRSDLDTARRVYAEEIRVKAGLRSRALFEAFAAVPREHYRGGAVADKEGRSRAAAQTRQAAARRVPAHSRRRPAPDLRRRACRD